MYLHEYYNATMISKNRSAIVLFFYTVKVNNENETPPDRESHNTNNTEYTTAIHTQIFTQANSHDSRHLLKMVRCTVHCKSNHCWSHDLQEHLLHRPRLRRHFPPPWWQATFRPCVNLQDVIVFCMLSSNLRTPPLSLPLHPSLPPPSLKDMLDLLPPLRGG